MLFSTSSDVIMLELLHMHSNGWGCGVQTESICEAFGIVCVTRDGENMRKLLFENELLYEHRVKSYIISL